MDSRYLTPEQKTQIRLDNKELTGSMTARAETLGAKYGFSRHAISNVIRNMACITKRRTQITDEEKQQILALYEQCELPVVQHRLQHVSKIVNRSTMTIRNIILVKKEKAETYFNPKLPQF